MIKWPQISRCFTAIGFHLWSLPWASLTVRFIAQVTFHFHFSLTSFKFGLFHGASCKQFHSNLLFFSHRLSSDNFNFHFQCLLLTFFFDPHYVHDFSRAFDLLTSIEITLIYGKVMFTCHFLHRKLSLTNR